MNKRRQIIKGSAGIVCTATSAVLPQISNAKAETSANSAAQDAAHLINRLGFGPRPKDIDLIAANPKAWVEQQLQAESKDSPYNSVSSIPKGPFSDANSLAIIRDYQQLVRDNTQQIAAFTAMLDNASRNESSTQPKVRVNSLAEYIRRFQGPALHSRLKNALENPRQLEEVMVDFWFNHFNVFQGKNAVRVLVGHYEQFAIRPHALGRFKDLLSATAHHPAMLFYLDNAQSVAAGASRGRGLNENYARELMELHTLGVDAGYSQKDVTELARILTGWTVAVQQQRTAAMNPDETSAQSFGASQPISGFVFNDRTHDKGSKFWLGMTIEPNGKAEGDFALDHLAKHPACARNICFKLAQYFVSDSPSTALVEQLANIFLAKDGEIVPVLRHLFNSTDFWSPTNRGNKFKSPYHYSISVLRAVDAKPESLQGLAASLAQQGMPLFGCTTPNGYKNTEAAWLNPDGMTKRVNFASQIANGRLGNEKLTNTTNLESLIQTLGPIASLTAKDVALRNTQDPPLSLALLLASPNMMQR